MLGLTLWSFFAVLIVYIQRTSFLQETASRSGALGWTQMDQGMLQVAFYCGYLAVQISAGYLCQKFGGKVLIIVGLATSSLCSAMIPIIVDNNMGLWCVFVVRVLFGSGQGAVYPGIMDLVGRCVPPSKTSGVVNGIFSGGQMGSIINLLLHTWILKATGGWFRAFFLYSSLGICCMIGWMFFLPNLAPRTKCQGSEHDLFPWKWLIRQPQFIALLTMYLSFNWMWVGWPLILPKYFQSLYGWSPSIQAPLTAIPYALCFCLTLIVAFWLQWKTIRLSNPVPLRRSVTVIGFSINFLFLILAAIATLGSSSILSFVFVSLSLTTTAITKSGFSPYAVDLSSIRTGQITGACFLVVSLVGLISNFTASFVLSTGGCTDRFPESQGCKLAYCIVLGIGAIFYALGSITSFYFMKPVSLDEIQVSDITA